MSSSLDIFGDRWTLLVLRDVLLESRNTYKKMLEANPGIATNILADRLKRLQARGLLSKQRDSADARQFIYLPTELSIAVIPMLVEMIIWGATHANGSVDNSFMRSFKQDRNKLISELKAKAQKSVQSE